jgi:hemerythrin
VGVGEIDEQHKRFIDMVNEFCDAMKEGKTKKVLEVLIDKVVDFMSEHRRTEETMMLERKYPGYAAHKDEHDRIMARAFEFQKKFKQDELGLGVELLSFLMDWYENHTKVSDRKYAEYFKQNNK